MKPKALAVGFLRLVALLLLSPLCHPIAAPVIGIDTFNDTGISFEYQLTDLRGRAMRSRATASFTSDHRQFTSKWELSVDDGKTWMPFMEYTGKKVGK